MSRAVIDQPGLKVIVIGLLLAGVLGLAFKSQISQDRIDQALNKSVKNLRQDFRIDYRKAEVRLSKWGLPLPHLLIEDLRLSPLKISCQNTQVYIDELELPLTFEMLFSRQPLIEKIRARQVELRLSEMGDCLNFALAQDQKRQVAQDEKKSQAPAQENALLDKPTRAVLNEIVIENFKVVSHAAPDQPLLFRQFHLYLDYQNKKLSQVEIKTKFYAFRDLRSETYYLVSDVQSIMAATANNQFEYSVNLTGRLLDGLITLFAQGQSSNQMLTYDLKAQKVTTKSLAPLIRYFNKSLNLDKWPLVLNFQVFGNSSSHHQKTEYRAEFRDIVGFGDNIQLSVPHININYEDNRTQIEPFLLKLVGFPLSPFKSILPSHLDLRSLESLGQFNGEFDYRKSDDWKVTGSILKPEIIFSNKGQREYLIVDQVNLDIRRKSDITNFNLEDIVISGQPVEGDITGNYSSPSRQMSLKTELSGHVLPDKIWQQFTDVNQNPMVKIQWSYKKGQEERHQLKLTMDQLLFPGLNLKNPQIDFAQINDQSLKSLYLTAKAVSGELQPLELGARFLKPMIDDEGSFGTEAKALSKGQIVLQGESWKSMKFDLEATLDDLNETSETRKPRVMKAKGEWLDTGEVSGQISSTAANQMSKFFIQRPSGKSGELKLTSEPEIK